MSSHAVIAIVNFEGKILLGKKKTSSPKFLAGEWHIPGETVEFGESDSEALIRGIKEEANISVKVGRYVGSSITPTSKKLANWYECFAETDKFIAGSDLEEIKWVSRKDVLDLISPRVSENWPMKILDYFR